MIGAVLGNASTGSEGATASIFVTGLAQTDSVSMTTPSGQTITPTWVHEDLSLNLYDGSKVTDKECENVTGGWTANGYVRVVSGTTVYTITPATKYSDRLHFQAPSSDPKQQMLGTSEMIDLSAYSSLNIDCQTNNVSNAIQLMLVSDKRYGDSLNLLKYQNVQNPTRGIVQTDISSIDSAYITLQSPNASTRYGDVYKVWAEGVREGFLFDNLDAYGNYTITASNGTKTKTETVLVDEATDFEIEMYYEALRLYWDGKKYENWAVRPTQNAVTEFNELTDHFEVKSLYSSGSRKYGYAQIWMPDLLDFTGYSTIKVLVKASALSYFGLVKSDGGWVNGYVSFSNGQYAELTQNITDISGKEQSITIGTYENSSAVTLYIQRVWLE